MEFEKQQRLLLRGIADLKSQANRAFASGMLQDFVTFATSSREFKSYVRDHVTAPEILAYAGQIPDIRHGSTEPSLLSIIFMIMFRPLISLLASSSRAKNYTIQDARTAYGCYANLEILVRMMEA